MNKNSISWNEEFASIRNYTENVEFGGESETLEAFLRRINSGGVLSASFISKSA
jgi:hypothetical protein